MTRPFPARGTYDAVVRPVRRCRTWPIQARRRDSTVDGRRAPGGAAAVEDVDIAGAACDRRRAALARTNELYCGAGAVAWRRPARSGSGCPPSSRRQRRRRRRGRVSGGAARRRHAGPAAHAAQHPRAAIAAGLADGAGSTSWRTSWRRSCPPDTVVTTARIVQSWGWCRRADRRVSRRWAGAASMTAPSSRM